MFARFDENPAMTLRIIKETKRYGQTHGRTDGRTDNVKTVYPLQTKFAGGIKSKTNSSLPHQDDCKTGKDKKNCTKKHGTNKEPPQWEQQSTTNQQQQNCRLRTNSSLSHWGGGLK